MTDNATAITLLCSHLCIPEGCAALEPSEWTALAEQLVEKKLQPADLLRFSNEDFLEELHFAPEQATRVQRLLDRSGAVALELSRYKDMGIKIITRADKLYPHSLKTKLGKACPPLFYYAGKLALANQPTIGFVGSRDASQPDIDRTGEFVKKANDNAFSVVSGGARGIDTAASQAALLNDNSCVEYLSDSLLRKLRSKDVITALQSDRLLLLSVAKPDAGFNTGIAMMRNKFIYAQSEATIVMKSDYKKGGTWNGASEALKHGYCRVLCYDVPEYQGNQALIEAGAIPIGCDWDGRVPAQPAAPQPEVEQLTLFS